MTGNKRYGYSRAAKRGVFGTAGDRTDFGDVKTNFGTFATYLPCMDGAEAQKRVGADLNQDAFCMLHIHIYLPPSRPISVLKISSHPPSLCRSVGFENVQDGVARPFLYGWPRASDSDQGCCADRFFGRRARAGSKQNGAGVCADESAKATASCPTLRRRPRLLCQLRRRCRRKVHRSAPRPSIHRQAPSPSRRPRAALARRQRQGYVGRIASSAY